MPLHIHIDAIGGLSGDMFIASMFDAFPRLNESVHNDLDAAGILNHVNIQQTKTLVNGVGAASVEFVPTKSNPRPTHHYKHIKNRLEKSQLSRTVLKRALAIFDLLAAAEATVHAVKIDDVHFHEIADWDSQADIVAAASIVEHIQALSWSCSALPMGGGSVQTEHGRLPVPAPATTELLLGFTMHDDGEQGERITPTGAAILAHLINPNIANKRPDGHLKTSGTGCGKKRFNTLPNITRVIAFELTDESNQAANSHLLRDQVGVINFEVDDMTPEELATGIEHLRDTAGVIDVSHHVRVGKKNRTQFSLQILCTPEQQERVIEACFLQTTTIGLRTGQTLRTILRRQNGAVAAHGKTLPIKQSQRPNGISSAKVESDALLEFSTLVERRAVAKDAEQLVPERND